MNNQTESTKCPICFIGYVDYLVTKHVLDETIDGIPIVVDLHYAVCDYCGSEQATVEQIRLNKEAYIKGTKGKDR